MGVTDRLFALRETPPFDRLQDREQILISEVCRRRSYGAGDRLCWAGQTLHRLYVVTGGGFVTEAGAAAPPIVGLASLLFGHESPVTLVAGDAGATTLEIERGHLYTILYECPTLATGLLEQGLLSPEMP